MPHKFWPADEMCEPRVMPHASRHTQGWAQNVPRLEGWHRKHRMGGLAVAILELLPCDNALIRTDN